MSSIELRAVGQRRLGRTIKVVVPVDIQETVELHYDAPSMRDLLIAKAACRTGGETIARRREVSIDRGATQRRSSKSSLSSC